MPKKRIRWRKLDNAAKIFPIVSNKRFTSVFRVSVILKGKIDKEILQEALNQVIEKQVSFKVKLTKGFFWYYLEENLKRPEVKEENDYPCRYINFDMNNGYLFDVTYFENKINLDVFHSLTDGNIAIKFLQEITYNYLDIKNKTEKEENEKRKSILSNNIEDSYLKNYNKEKTKREKSEKAYILKGKKLPLGATGIVHNFINLEQLKKVAKEADATITEYLGAVFVYCIYTENYKLSNSKKPIKVCFPVDLKKYYPSNTITNFFSYISVDINVVEKNEYSFLDILDLVKKQFKKKLVPNEIEKTMGANIKIGTNFLIRLVPLFLKRILVNISYKEIRKYSTTTISNLGKISVKEEYQNEIDNFLFLLCGEAIEKDKGAIVSYNNNLVFTFTSILENSKIERAFYEFIKSQNIEICTEGNGVYDVIS
ncbi:MAG: hypothetical protein HFJ50_05040 [Clostridia bacterium]|jgi:hypothetical protein|nr:hypothetical protein [Clostridia bacterium]